MTDIDADAARQRAGEVLGLDETKTKLLDVTAIEGGWRVLSPQTGSDFGASDVIVRARDGKSLRISVAISDERAARTLRDAAD